MSGLDIGGDPSKTAAFEAAWNSAGARRSTGPGAGAGRPGAL